MNIKQTMFRNRAAPVFTVLLGSSLTMGRAGAQTEDQSRLSLQQTALIRSTCADVMRIRPGFIAFSACVESLSQTLSQNGGDRMISKGTAASNAVARPQETNYSKSNAEERRRKEEYSCLQMGFFPGSAGLSHCAAQLDGALRSTEQSE